MIIPPTADVKTHRGRATSCPGSQSGSCCVCLALFVNLGVHCVEWGRGPLSNPAQVGSEGPLSSPSIAFFAGSFNSRRALIQRVPLSGSIADKSTAGGCLDPSSPFTCSPSSSASMRLLFLTSCRISPAPGPDALIMTDGNPETLSLTFSTHGSE